jgi:hypothetical protein
MPLFIITTFFQLMVSMYIVLIIRVQTGPEMLNYLKKSEYQYFQTGRREACVSPKDGVFNLIGNRSIEKDIPQSRPFSLV